MRSHAEREREREREREAREPVIASIPRFDPPVVPHEGGAGREGAGGAGRGNRNDSKL